MKKKKSFNAQFKRGTVPLQPVDESNRVYRKEPAPPSAVRKRQGVALGFQSQARPGLSGMSDYPRKAKRGR